MEEISTRLKGVTIAVPETRQLDTMSQLLERRGATVVRSPLVAIRDAPDPVPVLDWIRRFISTPPDLLIVLTGEGIKRLLSLADRNGLGEDLTATLKQVTLICRGPKPDRALREIGLKGGIQASAPTTDGIIVTLGEMSVENKRVAVQLYGEDPNEKLVNYLRSRNAEIDTVAPYVYADSVEESRVVDLIGKLSAAEIHAIAFTSQPQFKRLRQVAHAHGLEQALAEGLSGCCVAAVGPVVRAQLEEAGVRVDIMPEQAFFMKPLVTEIMRYFTSDPKKSARDRDSHPPGESV